MAVRKKKTKKRIKKKVVRKTTAQRAREKLIASRDKLDAIAAADAAANPSSMPYVPEIPDAPKNAKKTVRDCTERKRVFLKAIVQTGRIDLASVAANVGYGTHVSWCTQSREFKKAYTEAREASADHLEDAAYERAVDGVEKPVYQGGRLVGYEQKHSDALTMFLLKGQRPKKYRDNSTVAITDPEGGPVKVITEVVLVKAQDKG